jgi:hypothetical protein
MLDDTRNGREPEARTLIILGVVWALENAIQPVGVLYIEAEANVLNRIDRFAGVMVTP